MSKRFAVGYIDFYDNKLIIEIYESGTAEEAVIKHSKLKGFELSDCSSLEEMKVEAFNGDCMIDAVEIPDAAN